MMLMMRFLVVLFVCLFALPGGAAVADEAAAQNLQSRLWATAEDLRLVLETDKPLEYSVSSLEKPARLVVDIHLNAGSVDALNAEESIRAAAAYVSGIRAARHNNKTLRVVFELSAAVRYEVMRLLPIEQFRYRLVMDIIPQEPPEDPLFEFIQQLGLTEAEAPPFVVLLDPGHGGEDPGAVSPNNNYEKNVVLATARRIRDEINRRPGLRAVLSRREDKFIKLYDRVHLAHRLKADAFISVHADSVKSRKARGSSVFVLSEKGASSKFARNMAQRANLSDLIGGAPAVGGNSVLETALRQFSHDGKDRASQRMAQLILDKISTVNTMHSKRVESAGFAVLKSPSIPSVLVELAFISNPIEEKKLLDANFQQQMAVAIADAVEIYRRDYYVK